MVRKEALLQRLALAERHVSDGRRIVARQRAFIASRKEAGHDTRDAEALLDQFERTLEIFEEDHLYIRAELENSK